MAERPRLRQAEGTGLEQGPGSITAAPGRPASSSRAFVPESQSEPPRPGSQGPTSSASVEVRPQRGASTSLVPLPQNPKCSDNPASQMVSKTTWGWLGDPLKCGRPLCVCCLCPLPWVAQIAFGFDLVEHQLKIVTFKPVPFELFFGDFGKACVWPMGEELPNKKGVRPRYSRPRDSTYAPARTQTHTPRNRSSGMQKTSLLS